MTRFRDFFSRFAGSEAKTPEKISFEYAVPSTLGEVRKAEEAFVAYTGHRRQRLEAQVGRNATKALRLLPLLLHVNQPGVPGYVDDKKCPVGVANYQPTDADFRLARVFFQTRLRRAGVFRPFIELVAAMGSVGSIAFSKTSDLDLWLCFDDFAMDADRIDLYRRKVAEIEAWLGEATGRPVTLFLQASRAVKIDDFGQAGGEGCGSAMGQILKEEFYRTHVHLAGRYPFWWVLPPGTTGEDYERFVRQLIMDHEFRPDRYVDLGCASPPALGEFFGAAIWQIVKAWHSPLKSVLKMALLERNVLAGATGRPLCERLKEWVLQGEKLDPYCVLTDEILADCSTRDDTRTIALLGRCFYLKAGARLDPEDLVAPAAMTEDQATLLRYVTGWGWGPETVERLNDFRRWKYEEIRALNQEMTQYLLACYGRIRDRIEQKEDTASISPRDLTVLGRKLQSVYGFETGKVNAFPILSTGIEESYLSLHQVAEGPRIGVWNLYRGLVKHWELGEKETSLLRGGPDPLEILAWATRNRILGHCTRLIGRSPRRFLSPAYMENLSTALNRFFAGCEDEAVTTDALLEDPRIQRLLVLPNFGMDDESIEEMAILYWTSWGETFYRRWQGSDCFDHFAHDAFLPFLEQTDDPGGLLMLMPTREVGNLRWNHWRIQFDFPKLAVFLGGRHLPKEVRRRHVGQSARGFFVLERNGPTVTYETHRTSAQVINRLERVGDGTSVGTRVEARAGVLSILKTVADTGELGFLDLFCLHDKGKDRVFVSDEAGHLIHFADSRGGKTYPLAKILMFVKTVFRSVSRQKASPLYEKKFEKVLRIYTLHFDETCTAIRATREHATAAAALGLAPRRLVVRAPDGWGGGEKGRMVVQWSDDRKLEGPSSEVMTEIRKRVMASRADGGLYAVHVTGVGLDPETLAQAEKGVICTGHYLHAKRMAEAALAASPSSALVDEDAESVG